MSHKKRQSQVEQIMPAVEKVRNEALSLADQHIDTLNRMGELENYSASNLLHYLAVRQHDVRRLQVELTALGLVHWAVWRRIRWQHSTPCSLPYTAWLAVRSHDPRLIHPSISSPAP